MFFKSSAREQKYYSKLTLPVQENNGWLTYAYFKYIYCDVKILFNARMITTWE
jgi:hypothetical protein